LAGKIPAECKDAWDDYKFLAATPAREGCAVIDTGRRRFVNGVTKLRMI
jgi:hypothetical protein